METTIKKINLKVTEIQGFGCYPIFVKMLSEPMKDI